MWGEKVCIKWERMGGARGICSTKCNDRKSSTKTTDRKSSTTCTRQKQRERDLILFDLLFDVLQKFEVWKRVVHSVFDHFLHEKMARFAILSEIVNKRKVSFTLSHVSTYICLRGIQIIRHTKTKCHVNSFTLLNSDLKAFGIKKVKFKRSELGFKDTFIC